MFNYLRKMRYTSILWLISALAAEISLSVLRTRVPTSWWGRRETSEEIEVSGGRGPHENIRVAGAWACEKIWAQGWLGGLGCKLNESISAYIRSLMMARSRIRQCQCKVHTAHRHMTELTEWLILVQEQASMYKHCTSKGYNVATAMLLLRGRTLRLRKRLITILVTEFCYCHETSRRTWTWTSLTTRVGEATLDRLKDPASFI